jgi:hypothetical protein
MVASRHEYPNKNEYFDRLFLHMDLPDKSIRDYLPELREKRAWTRHLPERKTYS